MSAIEKFDIKGCVTDSVTETFRSRLSMEMALLPEEPPSGSGIHRMAGSLNFAGKVTGIFDLQVTLDFGRIMAAANLDMAPDEVDLGTDVRDLIAEITTTIGGHLKSALDDAGLACVLSTPSITCGTDFTLKSLNMDRFERCVFRKDDHILIAEVGLKAMEGMETDLDFSAPDAMGPIPNTDPEKLNALDYQGNVSGTVIDVFESMFSLKLEAAETVSGDSLTGMRDVSSVCLIGDATGMVSIYVDSELSRRMAANMLGRQPEEIEGGDEIMDILGQLGSIVGGKLKLALTETGLRCALSAPFLTTGSDFKIEALNLERYEHFAFQVEGHTVLVEMGVKISELAKAAPAVGKDILNQKADSGAGKTKPAAAAKTRSAPDRPSQAQAPATQPAAPAPEDFGLEILLDIPVELTVELGRTKMPIHELLKLQPGSAVKLARLEGEPVDILAGDVLIARGEVVVRNEKYGIRITEITSRMDRLKGLK
jgi:flagellar motor switch protein FliN